MPPIVRSVSDSRQSMPPNASRVLITGFGPFRNFSVNPSWLAVRPLNNTVISTTDDGPLQRPIHITAIKVSVIYDTVLNTVPGFHARPPSLPESTERPEPQPPVEGYDFILHVGVAGPGDLRVEKLAHKTGYRLPDVEGELPPAVDPSGGVVYGEKASAEEERENATLMPDSYRESAPLRGFGKGYEGIPETLETELEPEKLVAHLKRNDTKVKLSLDAGRYLCDFIYYCSLASAWKCRQQHGECSKTLFLHCPPTNEPLSTEDVTNAIREIIVWVSKQQ